MKSVYSHTQISYVTTNASAERLFLRLFGNDLSAFVDLHVTVDLCGCFKICQHIARKVPN